MRNLISITSVALILFCAKCALVPVPGTIRLTQENKPWTFEVFGNPSNHGSLRVKSGVGCDVRWMIEPGRPVSKEPPYRNMTLSQTRGSLYFSLRVQPCNWYHYLEDVYPDKKCEFEVDLGENSGLLYSCCETQCKVGSSSSVKTAISVWIVGVLISVLAFLN